MREYLDDLSSTSNNTSPSPANIRNYLSTRKSVKLNRASNFAYIEDDFAFNEKYNLVNVDLKDIRESGILNNAKNLPLSKKIHKQISKEYQKLEKDSKLPLFLQ